MGGWGRRADNLLQMLEVSMARPTLRRFSQNSSGRSSAAKSRTSASGAEFKRRGTYNKYLLLVPQHYAARRVLRFSMDFDSVFAVLSGGGGGGGSGKGSAW